MKVPLCFALSLSAFIPSITVAQQYQIQPGSAGYSREELPAAADIDVSLNPNIEVHEFDVDMKDQPELYGLDQWSDAKVGDGLAGITEKLVFVYDVPLPWDPSMIKRVEEAKVVDEEANFPVPISSIRYCRGSLATANKHREESYAFAPMATSPSQPGRYSDLPHGEEPFVILDLAESEHLGVVPGHWRP